MKTIFDENLLKLTPKLAKDKYEDVLKVCEYLIQKYLVNQLKKLVHFDRIDEMEEFELDLLSKELHIDYYDPKYTLEEKRKVCKDSIQIHMKKGTVGAIKTICDNFYKKSRIIQWYEEGLQPGYFKIEIPEDQLKGKEYTQIYDFIKAIDNYKKASQILEAIVSYKEERSFQNYAYANFVAESFEYTQDVRKFREIKNETNYSYFIPYNENVEFEQSTLKFKEFKAITNYNYITTTHENIEYIQ